MFTEDARNQPPLNRRTGCPILPLNTLPGAHLWPTCGRVGICGWQATFGCAHPLCSYQFGYMLTKNPLLLFPKLSIQLYLITDDLN